MKINEDKKVDILISGLEERYSSIHKIRDRVQNIGIWLLGILITGGAWIIQSNITFNSFQKILIVAAVAVAFYVLRFIYLEDLKKGFCGQLRAAAKIEKTLGLFATGIFDESTEPIYQKSRESAGTKDGDGNFFISTYALLYVGVGFFILAVIFNGFCYKQKSIHHFFDQNYTIQY